MGALPPHFLRVALVHAHASTKDRKFCTRSIASVTVIALLAGCSATLSARAAKIEDADEASVAGCEFLGQVMGYSGWGSLAAPAGMENARNESRDKAAKLGATDIVWRSVSGSYSAYVSGQAYDCNSSRP